MAWTQSEIDILKAAIASGILSVHYSDRTVTYKTTAEQLQALALMQKEVNPTTSPTYRLASTSKGV